MLNHLDFKSLLLGGLLSALAGGGLYGLYVKHLASAAFAETTSYELLSDCVLLNADKGAIPIHLEEIHALLDRADKEMPALSKADAVVTVIAVSTGVRNKAAGYGPTLRQCVADIKTNRERAIATNHLR